MKKGFAKITHKSHDLFIYFEIYTPHTPTFFLFLSLSKSLSL